ncbi:MAG: M28 family peptidase [Deltaproteobacteria bacterium]|nr:M28 family peptidase [Deltaproteobacteria bacterium]
MRTRPLVAYGCLALLTALIALRYRPPSAVEQTASLSSFSAQRAWQQLTRISADRSPHPVGSLKNAALRKRLIVELKALGLAPEIQRQLVCSAAYRECAQVTNILVPVLARGATRKGPRSRDAVLLVAHYDSAPVSPGVGDDGLGVAAALEVARAVRAGNFAARWPFYLLFTDGEEAGLLGAEAFIKHHPLAQRTAAVVNIEARGVAGPSMLFELAAGNAAAVKLIGSAVARPITSSLFYDIYRRMPNDTDFSVFRRANIRGFNMALLGKAQFYHTPNDDLEHASIASLQHHGDNALALIRGLLQSEDPRLLAAQDAVFFDLLAATVVRWPLRWRFALGVLPLFLLTVGVLWARQRQALRATQLGWGALTVIVAVLLTASVAGLIHLLLDRLGALSSPWVAYPQPLLIAMVGLALSSTLAIYRAFGKRLNDASSFFALWLGYSLIGLLSCALLPAASFVLVVPATVAGLLGLLARGRPGPLAAVASALGAGLLILPIAWLIYPAIGTFGISAIALLAALIIAPMARALLGPSARRIDAYGPLALTVLGLLLFALLPKQSAAVPSRATLAFAQDHDRQRARLLLYTHRSQPPHELIARGSFSGPLRRPFDWSRQGSIEAAYIAQTTAVNQLVGATLRIDAGPAAGQLTLRVEPPAQTQRLIVSLPPTLRVASATIGATQTTAVLGRATRQQTHYSFWLGEQTPLTLVIDAPSSAGARLSIATLSVGLPGAIARLAKARPAWAIRSHYDDHTVVTRSFAIQPTAAGSQPSESTPAAKTR